MTLYAALYARISLDRQDGAGVERQLADGHALAKQRGWDVQEYVDNDLSAFQRKRRPEFERMLDDLTDGTAQALVAYHPDRLYRRVTDLERLVTILETNGAPVATVLAGDIDLATASGRMVARILAAAAQHESEHNAERITRAKRGRAAEGAPGGGGRRPFGLTADRTTVIEPEAVELRTTVLNLIAGSTMSAEARRLNAAGMRSTAGNLWTADSVARVIRAPYIAGMRTYKGIIVAEAAWPPIIDRPTFDRVSTLKALHRRGRPLSDQYLLTGLVRCGRCGFAMYAKKSSRPPVPSYQCTQRLATYGVGCGHNAIRVHRAEAHVSEVVESWLDDPVWRQEFDAFQRYGRTAAGKAQAELDEIDRRLVVLAESWARGDMGDREHAAARAVLEMRRVEAQAASVPDPRPARAVKAAQVRKLWLAGTTAERRALLGEMVQPIVVEPGRVPAAQRLDVRPTWAD